MIIALWKILLIHCLLPHSNRSKIGVVGLNSLSWHQLFLRWSFIFYYFQTPENSDSKYTTCGHCIDWVFRIVYLIVIIVFVCGYFAVYLLL